MVVNHFILQLSDAQARLSTLESELAHLKPILLMKPYALMHSDAPKHRKKKSAVAVGSDTNADGTDDAPAEDEVQQSPERRPRGQYYRQREQPLLANSPRKPGTSSRKATRVSMVDARTEHLLLAAKKIGRERASVLAAQNYQEQNDPKAGPSNIPMNQPSYKGKGTGYLGQWTSNDTLDLICNETRDAAHRVDNLLNVEECERRCGVKFSSRPVEIKSTGQISEDIDIAIAKQWRAFRDGYISWHLETPRYRLKNLL